MRTHVLKVLSLAILATLLHANAFAQMPREANTGNPAADDAAHVQAKNQWIKDHPEEYRKLGGSPESVIPDAKAPATKPAVPAANPFEAELRFVLTDVVAVASGVGTVSASELSEETNGLKREFPERITELQMGAGGRIRIVVPGKTDVRGHENLDGNKVEWVFDTEACTGCGKTLQLTLLEGKDHTRSYLMQSEDNEANMAYRFTFQHFPTH